MTFCQSGVNVQNQSLQAMEMTKNYEGWELEQSTIFTSKYSVADKVGILLLLHINITNTNLRLGHSRTPNCQCTKGRGLSNSCSFRSKRNCWNCLLEFRTFRS